MTCGVEIGRVFECRNHHRNPLTHEQCLKGKAVPRMARSFQIPRLRGRPRGERMAARQNRLSRQQFINLPFGFANGLRVTRSCQHELADGQDRQLGNQREHGQTPPIIRADEPDAVAPICDRANWSCASFARICWEGSGASWRSARAWPQAWSCRPRGQS